MSSNPVGGRQFPADKGQQSRSVVNSIKPLVTSAPSTGAAMLIYVSNVGKVPALPRNAQETTKPQPTSRRFLKSSAQSNDISSVWTADQIGLDTMPQHCLTNECIASMHYDSTQASLCNSPSLQASAGIISICLPHRGTILKSS